MHTSGPWKYVPTGRGDFAVTNDVGVPIGNVRGHNEENAKLIAAAPELLQALQEARGWLDNIRPRTAQLERDEALIDAAIAKAI